jgi:hypothetical protein
MVAIHGRNTRYSVLYSDPLRRHPGRTCAVVAGSRSMPGAADPLFAPYDVSSQLESAPEISGYKSLRLTLTGIY